MNAMDKPKHMFEVGETVALVRDGKKVLGFGRVSRVRAYRRRTKVTVSTEKAHSKKASTDTTSLFFDGNGDPWTEELWPTSVTQIVPATPQMRIAYLRGVQREKRIAQIKQQNWSAVSDHQVSRIVAILNKVGVGESTS